MTTEARISRLEGAYEQVDRRLDALSQSMGSLRSTMIQGDESLRSTMIQGDESLRNEMHQSIESLRNEMNSRFNNLYIMMVGGWITIMAAVLSVLLTILLKG